MESEWDEDLGSIYVHPFPYVEGHCVGGESSFFFFLIQCWRGSVIKMGRELELSKARVSPPHAIMCSASLIVLFSLSSIVSKILVFFAENIISGLCA